MNAPEEILTGFARVLRTAGLPVTMAATQTFVTAVSHLNYTHPRDVYWAGRATLCSSAAHIDMYDYAFNSWFSTDALPTATQAKPMVTTGYAAALEGEGEAGEDLPTAVAASAVEVLRHRDVASLSRAEQHLLARQFETLPLPRPVRRSRRLEPANHGTIDRVRTVRDQRRRGGEPGPLRYARRRERPRRIIFFIDVSGSMRPYADSLLRLAHHVTQGAEATEVFAIGTRLTRITPAMTEPEPEKALLEAGELIPDWAGGTRLADNLREFIATWGRRGLARGAVAVIASDGWERGDVAELGEQVRILAGLAKRLVWANPHAGKLGYEPIQGGIAVALAHLDGFVPGHSLDAFEKILNMIDNGGSYAGHP